MIRLTASDIERFWSFIEKTDTCWIWTGAKTVDGYGLLSVKIGERVHTPRAHRIAYFLANGELPDKSLVCHRCDNPKCCNPAHLFLGTHQDNMTDMAEKHRGTNTLTADQEKSIVEQFNDMGFTKPQLAEIYQVPESLIQSILRRKTKKKADDSEDSDAQSDDGGFGVW